MYTVPENDWNRKSPQRPTRSENDEVQAFLHTFEPSKRTGNLWRRLPDNRTATLFPGNFGDGYCWCLADAEGPTFSPHSYATVEETAQALLDQLQEEGVSW